LSDISFSQKIALPAAAGVLAHRPQEEPGETTMTARPDHKKIGIL
jgi:hypothetical protein